MVKCITLESGHYPLGKKKRNKKNMPLIKSASKEAIGKNISEMESSGHSKAQSIAAALSAARKSGVHLPKKQKKKQKGK